MSYRNESARLNRPGNILLVARQPVHCLGEDQVEAAACGVCDQRLDTRTEKGGAGDRVIGIFLDNAPALLLGMKPAHAKLASSDAEATTVSGISSHAYYSAGLQKSHGRKSGFWALVKRN